MMHSQTSIILNALWQRSARMLEESGNSAQHFYVGDLLIDAEAIVEGFELSRDGSPSASRNDEVDRRKFFAFLGVSKTGSYMRSGHINHKASIRRSVAAMDKAIGGYIGFISVQASSSGLSLDIKTESLALT